MVNYKIALFKVMGRFSDAENVLNARLWPSDGSHLDSERGRYLDKGTLDAIRNIPGVVSVEETSDAGWND